MEMKLTQKTDKNNSAAVQFVRFLSYYRLRLRLSNPNIQIN